MEQEASNFVAGFATIAMSSATGKHEQADPEGTPGQTSIPDPTNMASVSADAQSSAAGGIPTEQHDKTKKPMEEAIWQKMRPIMHIIGDVADGWERFAKHVDIFPSLPASTDLKKCSISYSTVSPTDTSMEARQSPCARYCFGNGHHICHVHEDDHLLLRSWILWRPLDLEGTRILEQGIPKLAEVAGNSKVCTYLLVTTTLTVSQHPSQGCSNKRSALNHFTSCW